jgi:HAD superfamily hydrolase (TIGR01549 family)
MTPSVVVFDIGGVLVDWKPQLAWADEFETEADAFAFMERVEFSARNLRGDNGERFADMAVELEDLEDQRRFAAYVQNFPKTVQGLLQGTWDIVDELHAKNVPVNGITNWSAETWPEGLKAHPRLGEIFETLVVSGAEGIIKPDPRIFAMLCERAGVKAQDCVFIDDSLKNVEGAKAAGWDAIHFTSAGDLRVALEKRGLL